MSTQHPNQTSCPECGAAVPQGRSSCESCGMRLPGATPIFQPQAAHAVAAQPQRPKFCSNCQSRLVPASRFCQDCGVGIALPSQSSPAAPPVVEAVNRTPAILAIFGGALAAVGSVMPWVTIVAFFGSISRSGVDDGNDGIVTLAAGALAVLAGIVSLSKRPARSFGVLLVLLALLAGAVAVLDLREVTDRVAMVNADADGAGRASVGAGLYVIAAGAIVMMAAGLSALRKNSS